MVNNMENRGFSMNTTAAIVMASYLAVMMLVGYISSRKVKSSKGFFLADRRLGLITTSSTLAATTIGGSATIVACAYVYQFGLPGLWMDLAAGLGLIVLGLTIAARVRASKAYTLPELVEKLYDQQARTIATVLVIMAEIAWTALLIQSMRFILQVGLDISYLPALFITTLVFIIYTIAGGQWAVAYSDTLQVLIMAFGLLISLPYVFSGFAISHIPMELPAESWSFPVSQGFGFTSMISIFLLMFLPHLVGSDIYSKVLSARNQTVAKRSAVIAGLVKIGFGVLITLLGLAAIILLPPLSNPALALPTVLSTSLPPILMAVVLASLVAVIMSSADSILLTAGTVISRDLIGRFTSMTNDRSQLLVSRISILFIGLLGLALALLFDDIITILKLGYTLFVGGLVIPILAGFYKNRLNINNIGAKLAFVSGAAASMFWMFILPILQNGHALFILPSMVSSLDPVIPGLVFSALVLFIVSWITGGRQQGREEMVKV